MKDMCRSISRNIPTELHAHAVKPVCVRATASERVHMHVCLRATYARACVRPTRACVRACVCVCVCVCVCYRGEDIKQGILSSYLYGPSNGPLWLLAIYTCFSLLVHVDWPHR